MKRQFTIHTTDGNTHHVTAAQMLDDPEADRITFTNRHRDRISAWFTRSRITAITVERHSS